MSLKGDGPGSLLEVEDNGHGFDPSQPGPGLGLTTMRERAQEIGARLEIRTRPGEGTHLCLRF